MSNLKLEEIDNSIHIELDPVYSIYLKKELITGIVVDVEYISIHFVDELKLSDFKIPIGKNDNLSKIQLEFLKMINDG